MTHKRKGNFWNKKAATLQKIQIGGSEMKLVLVYVDVSVQTSAFS